MFAIWLLFGASLSMSAIGFAILQSAGEDANASL
jgi:hypothetical protein